ncbi:MAG: hypothetical protein ACREQ5_34950, partial [Candidatus Dormibacteria bacterium]
RQQRGAAVSENHDRPEEAEAPPAIAELQVEPADPWNRPEFTLAEVTTLLELAFDGGYVESSETRCGGDPVAEAERRRGPRSVTLLPDGRMEVVL